jgi:hypothetical protein
MESEEKSLHRHTAQGFIEFPLTFHFSPLLQTQLLLPRNLLLLGPALCTATQIRVHAPVEVGHDHIECGAHWSGLTAIARAAPGANRLCWTTRGTRPDSLSVGAILMRVEFDHR